MVGCALDNNHSTETAHACADFVMFFFFKSLNWNGNLSSSEYFWDLAFEVSVSNLIEKHLPPWIDAVSVSVRYGLIWNGKIVQASHININRKFDLIWKRLPQSPPQPPCMRSTPRANTYAFPLKALPISRGHRVHQSPKANISPFCVSTQRAQWRMVAPCESFSTRFVQIWQLNSINGQKHFHHSYLISITLMFYFFFVFFCRSSLAVPETSALPYHHCDNGIRHLCFLHSKHVTRVMHACVRYIFAICWRQHPN